MSKFVAEASGISTSVAEVGEQLAWLGAALRSSPYPAIAYCTPCITDVQISNVQHQGPGKVPSAEILYKIDFTMQKMEEPRDFPNTGQCWHGLFQNPVVVVGYPILRRPHSGTGLEISLDLMAKLIQARRVTCFDQKVFIKSFSAIIFPMLQVADCVVWHLLSNGISHISYVDPRIRHLINQSQTEVGVFDLATSRHILGWSSNVKSYAGAPDATYTMEWSGLKKPNDESSQLRDVVVRNGELIRESKESIGKKDMMSRGGYSSVLKWFENKFINLFDTKDRRSWLIDGASAILHLVRASIAHDKRGNFSHEILLDQNDIEEIADMRNRKAALTREENKSLKICKDDVMQQYHQSSQHTPQQSYILLKERIEQIIHILEQVVSYQSRSNYRGPRGQLEGFDFMDLASNEDFFYSRVTALHTTGKGWVDFLRATQAPTLFGQGFGEIIKPVKSDERHCLHWAELPRGMDYLAVSVSDLKEILRKKGSGLSNPFRLIDGIHWHKPDRIFEPCQCGNQTNTHEDLIQVLIPELIHARWGSKFNPPNQLKDDGAVIFGYSKKCPLHWSDYGDPEESGLTYHKESKSPPSVDDSGMGSSLSTLSDGESHRQKLKKLTSYQKTSLSTPKLQQTNSIDQHQNSKDSHQTFRVKGVFTISFLRSDLKTHTDLQLEPGVEVRVRSFVAKNDSSSVAIVSFTKIPAKLCNGDEWELAMKSEKEVDLNAVDNKTKITIDKHFRGLTIVVSPEADKHNVHYLDLWPRRSCLWIIQGQRK
ncbi:hypothetical protein GGS24DRAFT_174111 [Hypoxylon argillaceum]|nr:hypothetical protein GGS24DRAFT_174111 [Hypoxylon argillaceum]